MKGLQWCLVALALPLLHTLFSSLDDEKYPSTPPSSCALVSVFPGLRAVSFDLPCNAYYINLEQVC